MSYRIALISTSALPTPPPRYGGTELIVAELARGLSRLGHHVTVFATGDSSCEGELHACIATGRWPPDAHVDLAHAAFAMREIANASPPFDVVHAHIPAALPFARYVSAPMVYTVHHKREPELLALQQQNQEVTHVFISHDHAARHPEVERVAVVHHGVDTDRYALGSPSGGYVAFLGRFSEEKAPHLAIEAARRAGVCLRLAGAPHWKDERYFTREVAPRLALPGVEYIGEADHDTKLDLLGGADALLFPIQWPEPFGLVMIESMLCGTPVLAFPNGSAPEIVEHGVTGYLVGSVDQMAGAIARARALDRRRVRARAVERFATERMVQDYLALYSRLVICARDARIERPSEQDGA